MSLVDKLWKPPQGTQPTVTNVRSDSSSVPTVQPSRPDYLGESPRTTRARSATTVVADQSASVVDPLFDVEIRRALDSAKIGGYNELVMQFDELKEDIPDETKRLKRASSIVTKMLKLSAQQIMDSIKERLTILETERTEFNQAIQAQADSAVGAQTEVVQECNRRLGEIESELRRLASEKSKVESDLSQAQTTIDSVSTKVEGVKRRFEGTYQHHRNILTSLFDKMKAGGS